MAFSNNDKKFILLCETNPSEALNKLISNSNDSIINLNSLSSNYFQDGIGILHILINKCLYFYNNDYFNLLSFFLKTKMFSIYSSSKTNSISAFNYFKIHLKKQNKNLTQQDINLINLILYNNNDLISKNDLISILPILYSYNLDIPKFISSININDDYQETNKQYYFPYVKDIILSSIQKNDLYTFQFLIPFLKFNNFKHNFVINEQKKHRYLVFNKSNILNSIISNNSNILLKYLITNNLIKDNLFSNLDHKDNPPFISLAYENQESFKILLNSITNYDLSILINSILNTRHIRISFPSFLLEQDVFFISTLLSNKIISPLHLQEFLNNLTVSENTNKESLFYFINHVENNSKIIFTDFFKKILQSNSKSDISLSLLLNKKIFNKTSLNIPETFLDNDVFYILQENDFFSSFINIFKSMPWTDNYTNKNKTNNIINNLLLLKKNHTNSLYDLDFNYLFSKSSYLISILNKKDFLNFNINSYEFLNFNTKLNIYPNLIDLFDLLISKNTPITQKQFINLLSQDFLPIHLLDKLITNQKISITELCKNSEFLCAIKSLDTLNFLKSKGFCLYEDLVFNIENVIVLDEYYQSDLCLNIKFNNNNNLLHFYIKKNDFNKAELLLKKQPQLLLSKNKSNKYPINYLPLKLKSTQAINLFLSCLKESSQLKVPNDYLFLLKKQLDIDNLSHPLIKKLILSIDLNNDLTKKSNIVKI